MSNKNKISYTDVNLILFILGFFEHLIKILPSYGLTLEDVCNNPNKFRRFVHIFRHYRLCYNANWFTKDYPDVNDLQKLFTILYKRSIYYGKEKKES